jgi:hypothetical protein
MNLIMKQVLILGTIFTIILWFQHQDDKKTKRERKTFIDKYKLPLLVSSIIGLIMNVPSLLNLANNSQETLTEVTIITPVKNCNKLSELAKPFMNSNNFGTKTNSNDLTWFSKNPSDQQIYTDLPDF